MLNHFRLVSAVFPAAIPKRKSAFATPAQAPGPPFDPKKDRVVAFFCPGYGNPITDMWSVARRQGCMYTIVSQLPTTSTESSDPRRSGLAGSAVPIVRMRRGGFVRRLLPDWFRLKTPLIVQSARRRERSTNGRLNKCDPRQSCTANSAASVAVDPEGLTA